MSLFQIMPAQIPQIEAKMLKPTTNFNKLFSLNPDVTFSGNNSYTFTPSYSFGGFQGNSTNLQMGSFRLKNGMRINTYGDYNSKGYRMPNRSAMPWARNNFRGAFEMKSANGNFGIRLALQQGQRTPF